MFFCLGSLMFPAIMLATPLFVIFNRLELTDTYLGLILADSTLALPYGIVLLRPTFAKIPAEYTEAALIDGCSHTGVFFRVMLPMARPGIVSVALFNVLGLWNQYLLPLVLNQGDKSTAVLTEGLASLVAEQGYASDWSALFAGMVIAMLPVLLVYLVFQRRVRQGFVAGALK